MFSKQSQSCRFRLRKVLSLSEARHSEGCAAGEILSSDALVQEWYRGCEGQHCIEMLAGRHRD